MKTVLTIGMLLASAVAWADDFDITMNVIEANETFDEAIVNRIALPFTSSSASQAAKAKAESQDSLRQLDELEALVNERIGGAQGGGSADSGGSVPGVDGLPQGADLQTVLPQR